MSVTAASRPVAADLVIDALIGYSLRGGPVGTAAELVLLPAMSGLVSSMRFHRGRLATAAGAGHALIAWANDQAAPVLALDTPSGLDLTTGEAGTPAVWAAATLTLALPKVGLLDAPSAWELYLADISVPSLVYQRLGIVVPELFRQSSLLRIDP